MSDQFEYVHSGEGETVRIATRGRDVLINPMTNFGTTFTTEERTALGLRGLLPPALLTIHGQMKRLYGQFRAQPTDLAKYLFLSTLQDRNEILFYRLLSEHIDEMMPIIYTPTIGQAIEEYSHWYARPRGVYLDIDHPEAIEESLLNYGLDSDEVDLIVVTDSEGILGIGDQGLSGIVITVGKLAVYTAAAGVHPNRVLPVGLDTGTDNVQLLSDDAYMGVRHSRVRGQRYDDFIDAFARTAHRLFPYAMLHWEDFGTGNAHRILTRYRDELCTFNDDIQGTAAVVAAAVLSAVRRTGLSLSDQRIVIHGAGTAGVGIADLLVQLMVQEGLTEQEARTRFWALGSKGLIIEDGPMRDFQEPYARPREELSAWQFSKRGRVGLAEVVKHIHPTVLIGTSAQTGAFTEKIVRDMAQHCPRPIIMPLSNPTSRAEATPADLLSWTKGMALIATGSPFEPVVHDGVEHHIAQANNALVFPGIGLGVITTHAARVSDEMILAATDAVARATRASGMGASLLPAIGELRQVSASVGMAVAAEAIRQGLSRREVTDLVQAINDNMWRPEYPKVEAVESITG
jgi:malate dehydrogenase (oxaloacetate-decarboxylating)